MLRKSKCLASTKKPSFLLKSIYLYNPGYLAARKTMNTRAGVILELSFPKNKIFLEALFFNYLHFIFLPSIKGVLYIK